ncbi:MAG: ATP-binding cassette domain-containing protein [Oscillatoriales cyanobacterium]|nr:MAG: ATP-binding cassette domain-containing protein [Oscillatoriales cyanobacterium]
MQGSETVFGNAPHLYVAAQGQRLDFTLTADRYVLGREQSLADLVVPKEWATVSGYHAVLVKRGEDYWIFDGINPNTGQPSTNGLLLENTRLTGTEASGQGFRLTHGIKLQIGQNPVTAVTLTYFDPARALAQRELVAPSLIGSVDLRQGRVLLGRSADASIELDSPLVSRQHATIERSSTGYVLQDLSTNGTFINGIRVSKQAALPDRAIVRIGPFTLVRLGDQLTLSDEGNRIRLDAHNLSLNGRRREWVGLAGLGKEQIDGDKTAWFGLQRKRTFPRLQSVTMPIEPGQLVALVGGSGAGKSTLMRNLLGIEHPDTGATYINSTALRDNFNLYRNQIGYVPQQDILHRDLTVKEALTYTAQLRLPTDQSLATRVDQALRDVDMAHKTNDLVRDLSGGQLKRVSIAAELIADPKLFFLDEPTSGLDPGLDKKMMLLLQKLAKEGNRTIVLVTHATANIELCDRVAFLGRGGKLCYFGPPAEALDFFRVDSEDFADIYLALEPGDAKATDQAVNQWSAEFRYSKDYTTYVDQRLVRAEPNSKLTTKIPSKISPSASELPRSPVQQWQTLSERYWKMVLRDQLKLAIALLTGPVAIALIGLAVRNADVLLPSELDARSASLALRVLFVFTCAGLWVGLSGAIQEIVKEQEIYSRERLVNLGLLPYLGSKLTVLGGLALLQTVLTVTVIALFFKNPEPDTLPWLLGVAITTLLTLFSSLSLGLLVSTGTRNSAQANTLVPLILLPQIIFSGVLFKMEGAGEYISWLMLGRWSVGAYGSLVNVNSLVPNMPPMPNGQPMPLPFEPTAVYDPTWENLGWNFAAFGIHILVYLGLTLWLQKRKDLV